LNLFFFVIRNLNLNSKIIFKDPVAVEINKRITNIDVENQRLKQELITLQKRKMMIDENGISFFSCILLKI
jgi:hypothetical protein